MIRRIARVASASTLAALIACGAPHRAPQAPPPRPSRHAAPPAPRWSRGEVLRLDRTLATVLDASALTGAGIAVVDARGRPLFTRRATAPMIPASTFKLLVAATALADLGPTFRFATTFESFAAPDNGVIAGDLYLVGSGDPTLTRDDLRAGAGVLARSGVHLVQGALVADAGVFAPGEVNPAWDPDDLQYGYAAGVSALSLDGGTVEFHLIPTIRGEPARIDVVPPSSDVDVEGSVMTASTTLLSIERKPDRNEFVFDGRIAAGAEQSFWRPVSHLPYHAATVAQAMLAQRGIAIESPARIGSAPVAAQILWLHRSAPLRAILSEMLTTSDNHAAEELLRAVGALHGIGSERTGAIAERALLTRDGVPSRGLRIVDGSGLAASDRVAPITLAVLLARAAGDDTGDDLIAALPRVGIEGTVRWRHLTDALGRARAKSGHIAGVNALAGFVQSRRHGRLAFAVLVNDARADDDPVDDGIDAMLDALARS